MDSPGRIETNNQGRKEMNGVKPDYVIYQFADLRNAISFF
jgi:hypothetical protein